MGKNDTSKWLYLVETRQVLGLIYNVRNTLGTGWSEEIYHQVTVRELVKAGIPTQSKPRNTLMHREVEIHVFEPDIIVWDKIILELKVLRDFRDGEFPSVNQAQVLHYLNFYGMKLGVLINFAHGKVDVKRMVLEREGLEVVEDYERMLPYVDEVDKVILRKVAGCIRQIARQYGLGYAESVYRKLIAVELAYQGVNCLSDVHVPAMYEGEGIGSQQTPLMLIEGRFLLHVRALFDTVPFHDIAATRTFLKALGLDVGWVVNFGKETLQIEATTALP